MKYQEKIIVDIPLSKFIALLDNPENMQYWQRDLQSYQLLSGEPGAIGSTMQMNYLQGSRSFSLIETITTNELPRAFSATYECKGVFNSVNNTFNENADGSTIWLANNEFKFNGLMRVMSWFMPQSMFRKQTCQYMEDFKKFAERHTNE